ncbi:GNAT family N-acetyltransferase [Verticiella sediminum]|uniref:GNAT family N-acetyltransferase n=1 Tax=Verticiella sediminum TaxID=1247510 RepID=A0A556AXF7_9BURK|nr:GNAT family N-acetyltransferase [Verticiella sediminum]TSH97611.1 GNAT family N-acetyltransferase [Verticiella sediminum]
MSAPARPPEGDAPSRGKHVAQRQDGTPARGPAPTLVTPRLCLRPWRDADLAPFAALNADARVMRYFPAPLARAESDALAARIRGRLANSLFGLWAVEIPGVCGFAGFTGLCVPAFDAPFTPCVEIAWRLARAYWGQGYATEAARAALAYGLDTLGLDEIVAFTARVNTPSIAVMERIGMQRDVGGDFLHPALAPEHRLARHVLYRARGGRHDSGRA